MQILHRCSGSIQQYLQEISDPDRYRPDSCPQCQGSSPLIAHGFYCRTLVDVAFDGLIPRPVLGRPPSSLESCFPRDRILSLPIHPGILSHTHQLHSYCPLRSAEESEKTTGSYAERVTGKERDPLHSELMRAAKGEDPDVSALALAMLQEGCRSLPQFRRVN
jgi:hypothetical protein